jgi:hypothetical protein
MVTQIYILDLDNILEISHKSLILRDWPSVNLMAYLKLCPARNTLGIFHATMKGFPPIAA